MRLELTSPSTIRPTADLDSTNLTAALCRPITVPGVALKGLTWTSELTLDVRVILVTLVTRRVTSLVESRVL